MKQKYSFKVSIYVLIVVLIYAFCAVSQVHASNGSPREFCQYHTYKLYSINYTCDNGLRHWIEMKNLRRYGPWVTPGDDVGNGIGISMIFVSDGEQSSIDHYGTQYIENSFMIWHNE